MLAVTIPVDYDNLIACFPAPNAAAELPFGARKKGGRHVATATFVWPTSLSCETRFKFAGDGSVGPMNPDDSAAVATIATLGLDNEDLAELRAQAVISSGLVRVASAPLSAAAARRLAEKVCQPASNGYCEPFCVALQQVALACAEKEERRAARLRKKPAP